MTRAIVALSKAVLRFHVLYHVLVITRLVRSIYHIQVTVGTVQYVSRTKR